MGDETECVCTHPAHEHGDGTGERWPCRMCSCDDFATAPAGDDPEEQEG